MMTQSIIVYRNPVEAAFWESASSGQIFPVIVGVIVFFAVFLVLNAYVVERFVTFRKRAPATYVALFIGALAGVLVVNKMWI
jgi:multisubunit Na+/H+ antiporter MnhE subunit